MFTLVGCNENGNIEDSNEIQGNEGEILEEEDNKDKKDFSFIPDENMKRIKFDRNINAMDLKIKGLYALACQVQPEITPGEFWDLALETGSPIEMDSNENNYVRVNLGSLIEKVEKLK